MGHRNHLNIVEAVNHASGEIGRIINSKNVDELYSNVEDAVAVLRERIGFEP